MKNLILFLLRIKTLLLFLGLELIAFLLIVNNNQFQRSHFLSSSNMVVGTVYNLSDKVYNYFSLASVNESLAEQNRSLNTELTQLREQLAFYRQDTSYTGRRYHSVKNNYTFITAKVIHFSMGNQRNCFIINKGANDNVQMGMGVINEKGVVGIVRSVSSHFASVVPIIDKSSSTSATVKGKTQLGELVWRGGDFRFATLEKVPLYIPVAVGDTIVTSGNSTTFPEGFMVGNVESLMERNDNLYEINVALSVEFDKLSYVDVIKYDYAEEESALEKRKGRTDD